jgi:hypothetical protein
MCMIDGGDLAECWAESVVHARKHHKCCECNRTIQPGELYHKVFGKQDGDIFHDKWCAHCDVAKTWLWNNCGGSMLTMVEEDIHEHVSEYRRIDLARLDVGMRRGWKRIRRTGLMPIPKLPRPIKLGDARK